MSKPRLEYLMACELELELHTWAASLRVCLRAEGFDTSKEMDAISEERHAGRMYSAGFSTVNNGLQLSYAYLFYVLKDVLHQEVLEAVKQCYPQPCRLAVTAETLLLGREPLSTPCFSPTRLLNTNPMLICPLQLVIVLAHSSNCACSLQ